MYPKVDEGEIPPHLPSMSPQFHFESDYDETKKCGEKIEEVSEFLSAIDNWNFALSPSKQAKNSSLCIGVSFNDYSFCRLFFKIHRVTCTHTVFSSNFQAINLCSYCDLYTRYITLSRYKARH
jgi:hypothetical protein